MARKFRTGDKVRVARKAGNYPMGAVKVGHRGKITKYESGAYPYTVTRKNGKWDSFQAGELELL